MTPPELRVGIVGYGLAGREFHGRLLSATPGVTVTAVVTRDPRRREQAQADHPDARVHPDLASALAAGLDLVVVAAPNAVHAALATETIDAGVPVVVDKPLALTAEEAGAVVAHAEAADVPLTVFQNRRWDSDQLTLRKLLEAGELGEVLRHESRFERWRPQIATGKWRESLPADQGGGILLDLGSHLVDQALSLFGPVEVVYAEVDARRGGPEDDVFLALSHVGGVRSHLWVGALAGAPGPRLRVLGTGGALVVEELDGQEAALRAGLAPYDETWGVEPAHRAARLRRGEEHVLVPLERGRWDGFYPAVVGAVRDGSPMPVDPREAVATLEVLEAARRSASAGELVALRR